MALLLGSWGLGCGRPVAAPSPPRPAVLARSDAGDASIAELESALGPSRGAEKARPEAAATRRVLEQLLVEKGLAHEAESLRLASDPETAHKILDRRQELLLAAVEDRYVKARVHISDEAIAESYRARSAELAGVERIQLRHIFRRVPSRATPEERSHVREEMEDLLRQIRGGADFKELARTRSDSETAKFEGRMAAVARGQLDPSVEAIVWALEPGQVSDVVPTPLGFHIFQLERRIPAQALGPDAARKTVERSLRLQGEESARRALREELLSASGAVYRPAALRPGDGTTPVFELSGRSITTRDLEARRDSLPFVEQHTRTLADLLEEEVSRQLGLWKASVDKLADEPTVAAKLAREERRTLAEAAGARRYAERGRTIAEAELRALYDAAPSRFDEPQRHHLRVIVLRFTPEHSPHYFYERLDPVARDVRSGKTSFEDAARAFSDDPSAPRGGDLGFLLLRDFGFWAGATAYQRTAALRPGEILGPLAVEVYNEAALVYEPRAYMLVKLEEVRPSSPRSFDEARDAVAEAWMGAHVAEVAAEMQADVLGSIHAVIDEGALAALP